MSPPTRNPRSEKQRKVGPPPEKSGDPDFARPLRPERPHQSNRLISALNTEDFRLLEPDLELVNLRQLEVIYNVGQEMNYAYFPHDGAISLVAVLEEGASAEVAVFGREGVMGFVSSLVSRLSFGRYVVQVPGTASRIGARRLRQAVDTSPPMQSLFLCYTEALLAQTFQTVACNAVHSVEARCCRYILATHDRLDRDDLPLTHEFLAEMLGVQRPTVSIIARTLQSSGLIEQGRSLIRVVNRAGLERTACGCYRTIRSSFERLLPSTFDG